MEMLFLSHRGHHEVRENLCERSRACWILGTGEVAQLERSHGLAHLSFHGNEAESETQLDQLFPGKFFQARWYLWRLRSEGKILLWNYCPGCKRV